MLIVASDNATRKSFGPAACPLHSRVLTMASFCLAWSFAIIVLLLHAASGATEASVLAQDAFQNGDAGLVYAIATNRPSNCTHSNNETECIGALAGTNISFYSLFLLVVCRVKRG